MGPQPPKNIPPYYIVLDAGDTACNGKYIRTKTSDESSLVYTSQRNPLYQIYYYEGKTGNAGAGWRLAIRGVQVFYLAAGEHALPPTNGWKPVTAQEPAPSLAAGPSV